MGGGTEAVQGDGQQALMGAVVGLGSATAEELDELVDVHAADVPAQRARLLGATHQPLEERVGALRRGVHLGRGGDRARDRGEGAGAE